MFACRPPVPPTLCCSSSPLDPATFTSNTELPSSRLQLLPLARVRKMMKEAPDVKIVSAEASWAVARATVSVVCPPWTKSQQMLVAVG